MMIFKTVNSMFQHAAARRRLGRDTGGIREDSGVSTRSRPKAAGLNSNQRKVLIMFQHAAARRRLEATGQATGHSCRFQHAAARRRLATTNTVNCLMIAFQHAAARRRLAV